MTVKRSLIVQFLCYLSTHFKVKITWRQSLILPNASSAILIDNIPISSMDFRPPSRPAVNIIFSSSLTWTLEKEGYRETIKNLCRTRFCTAKICIPRSQDQFDTALNSRSNNYVTLWWVNLLKTYFSVLICGKEGTLALGIPPPPMLLLTVGSATTLSPSDFSWSTKESTSFDLPPNFIAFELTIGLLKKREESPQKSSKKTHCSWGFSLSIHGG